MSDKNYIISIIDGCTVVGKVISKLSDIQYIISKPRIIVQTVVGVLEDGQETAPNDPNRKKQRIKMEAFPFVYPECLDKDDKDNWTLTVPSIYRLVDDKHSIIKFYKAYSDMRSNVTKEGLVE